MSSAENDLPEVGLNVTFCDDEPMYAKLAGEKLKLATLTKSELEAAILDAAKNGWKVATRCHCSETGRHGAKLFRAKVKKTPGQRRSPLAAR